MKTIGLAAVLLGVAASASALDCLSAREELEARWSALWDRLQPQGDPADRDAAFRGLATRYCEPHRAYHTLAHVAHALSELDEVRGLAQDPDAVEIALWFHDVVYDIGSGDNEERSAELAAEAAAQLGLSPARADRVRQHVLATRHDSVPGDADSRLVVDIDLSILGQPAERFDAYEEEIRREYAPVIEARGEARFDAGRARVLRRFLERPAIYSTGHFRRKYEEAARANLRRSIERLEAAASVR